MSTTNSTDISPSSSPVNNSNNAPKFGTLVPNRIFVGGITANTSETELYDLFSNYGTVRATKIIADRAGVSKGYGFVTFDTEEEAKRIQKEESVMLKDRKLNIAPAIRKQASYGSSESSSERSGTPRQPRNSIDWSVVPSTAADPAPIVPSNGTVFYHNGASYYSPNGTVYAPAEGGYQYSQPQYYPTMVYSPTPVYIQPQYQSYQSPNPGQAQWTGQPIRWATHLGYGQSPSPHASANSPVTSIPTYVYSANNCPATPSTNSGQATSSATTTMASMQNQTMGEPNVAATTPIAAATITYSYPPPTILAPYHPQNGSGDVADLPIMEAATSNEQASMAQDSMGPTISHGGLSAAVHFVRAFPPPVHDSDEYRQASYDQGASNYRGYRKGYQGGSPHRPQFTYGVQSPRFRFKGRTGNPPYTQAAYNSNATPPPPHNNGNTYKKPSSNKTITPLTPPPTPSAIKESAPVAEAAHRLQSLKL